MTTITKKLADALRIADANATLTPCESAQVHAALAAYDAQRAAQAESDADVWHCDDGEFITKRGPFGSMQVACVDSPEDARRIVACVNACAGMTTAEIESFDSPGDLGRCAMLWAQEDDE